VANQNFRVKKGLEVGLGATFLYADDTGVGINSAIPRDNLDVRGKAIVGVDTTTPSFESIGISSFRSDVIIDGDLILAGDIIFDEFEARNGNVTGVLTTRNFVTTGIATIKELVVEDSLVFDGGNTGITSDTIETKYLNVTGVTTTRDLVVSGVSTFIGSVTTQDLFVEGTISANVGSFEFTELTGENLIYSGVATISEAVYSNAGIFTSIDAEFGDFEELNVSGFATVGFLTVTNDLTVEGNVNFDGTINIEIDAVIDQNVSISGITTTDRLLFRRGVGAGLTVRDLSVTGIATITEAQVDLLSFTDGVGTALTVTNLTAENFESTGGGSIIGDDITTRNLNVTGLSTFVGLSSFQTAIVNQDLQVAGVTTLNQAQVVSADIDSLASARATITEAEVGFASVTDLNVVGTSTFVGFATFQQNVSIGGTLRVVGDLIVDDITYDHVTGNSLEISGIATIQQAIVDYAQLLDAVAGVATVGFATIKEAYIGVLTTGLTEVGILTVTGQADFDANVGVAGSVTILGDLTIGGSQNTPQLGVTNLNVTGITTTNELVVTGVSSYVGLATFQEAFIADLTVDTITTGGGVLELEALETKDLIVTGVSTFVGVATFGDSTTQDATIVKLTAVNSNTLGVATARIFDGKFGTFDDLEVVGFATIGAGASIAASLDVRDSIGVGGTVGATTFYGNFIGSLGGVVNNLPAPSIVSDTAPLTRDSGEELKNGDIWYDSLNLRQYTYYVDPSSSQWVDSNPQITIPTFKFRGDAGSSQINLVEDFFNINGFENETETAVGVGSTVTIRLAPDIDIRRNISVAGFATVGTGATIGGSTYVNGDLFVTGIATVGGGITISGDIGVVGGTLDVDAIKTKSLLVEDVFFADTDEDNVVVSVGASIVGVLTATSRVWFESDLNVVGVITAQDINSTSDKRVKENIRPIENALDKVSRLNGVHFNFVNSGKASAGVIAQDVEQVFPDLIAGTFPKSVNYNGLIGALIESIKELKGQNELMAAEIEKLKKDK